MSSELKERMEHRRKGIRPPYKQAEPLASVIFPGFSTTTCDEVIEDVWKAAWEEALRVVDDYETDRELCPDNPNTAPPDIQYHMDDEVEIIHECYQNLVRLEPKARKRAIYYLHERIIGVSDEF